MTPTGTLLSIQQTIIIFSALVVYWTDLQFISYLNSILNMLMAVMLPFAILPTLCFTSDPFIMGEFANGLISKIAVCALTAVVMGTNFYFTVDWIGDNIPPE